MEPASSSRVARKRARKEEERVWDAFRQAWRPADEADEEELEVAGESSEEWVPLKERRRRQQERVAQRRKHAAAERDAEDDDDDDDDEEEEARAVVSEGEDNTNSGAGVEAAKQTLEADDPPTTTTKSHSRQSLVTEAMKMRSALGDETLEEKRQREEEERLVREASMAQVNALRSAKEVAEGTAFRESLKTKWRPPKQVSDSEASALRKKWGILIDGESPPAPIKKFEEMGLPAPLITALRKKGIKRPTPIQVQGIPVALSGRDMIGIAFTGSGKTVTFALPLLVRALDLEEDSDETMRRRRTGPGDGPVGVVLCPSRELARQTHDVISHFADSLGRDASSSRGFTGDMTDVPRVRVSLAVGGEDKRTQLSTLRSFGVHGLVATPGRLIDFLQRGDVSLDRCQYFCLDEGDRMLDTGFDDDVRKIVNRLVDTTTTNTSSSKEARSKKEAESFHYGPPQKTLHFEGKETPQRGETTTSNKARTLRQTLLFSATMPQKFRDFARSTLVRPIVVNVSRAGAANLDVIQEVEYVKAEARVVYLLECLQKTAPPVVVFCERKQDVDDVHEYLLLKGVDAVAIHGSKDQRERNDAVDAFKHGHHDVLVATDVAAKGLDFPDIQHVINFDMPSEIESYVHRIGRTGRCGKTGVATTFINKNAEPATLLDLKHLLIEAKQRVPPVLQVLDDLPGLSSSSSGGSGGFGTGALASSLGVNDDDAKKNPFAIQGCAFCGGLGHRITECPKREKDARRATANRRDMVAGTGGYGGDW